MCGIVVKEAERGATRLVTSYNQQLELQPWPMIQLYNCARQCTWRHQCVLCNQPSLVELSVNTTSSKQWSQLHPMYYVYMCTFMCTKLVIPTYMYLYMHVFDHNCTLCKCASMQLYKCVWFWINRPATGVSRDYWSVKHLNLRGNTTGASYIHYILHIEE